MRDEYAFLARDLCVGYAGKPLIHDIDIRLRKGEILTLIGPNGAGKSTILKSITRHLEPIAGTVFIGREDIRSLRATDLARQLSVVLTERIAPEMMSCYDVVAMGRYPYTGRFGVLTQKDHQIVQRCMERVRAQEIAQRDFTQISDGQRQRVLLARALCQEPEIIVLDEPTSFLDIRHKIELLSILLEMSREHQITVILSLHEIDLAEKISDCVLCVKGDTIACAGRPEEVFTKENIAALYDLNVGSYHVRSGSVELAAPEGEPDVFVVCGAGRGIVHFRALQKRRRPFYAGILFDNDMDYEIASSLSARTFAQLAFTPVEGELVEQARQALLRCKAVVDAGTPIREMNRANGVLLQTARERHIRIVRRVDELD